MQAFLSPTTSLPLPPPPLSSPDSARASVVHLLSRAHSLPCSKGALAFTQYVQPTARFQLALDALLPILDYTTSAEVSFVRSPQSDDVLITPSASLRVGSSCLLSFTLYTPHILSRLTRSSRLSMLLTLMKGIQMPWKGLHKRIDGKGSRAHRPGQVVVRCANPPRWVPVPLIPTPHSLYP